MSKMQLKLNYLDSEQFPVGKVWEVESPDWDEAESFFYPESVPGVERYSLNFVISANGSISGDEGKSGSISDELDRRFLRRLRRVHQLVLTGAETIRAEGLHIPPAAKLVVFARRAELSALAAHPRTLSGELPLPVILAVPDSQATAFEEKFSKFVEQIIKTPDNELSVSNVIEQLRLQGYEHFICEGGANLADQFFEQNLISQAFITLSPKLSNKIVQLNHWPNSEFKLQFELESNTGFRFQSWLKP